MCDCELVEPVEAARWARSTVPAFRGWSDLDLVVGLANAAQSSHVRLVAYRARIGGVEDVLVGFARDSLARVLDGLCRGEIGLDDFIPPHTVELGVSLGW